MHKRLETYPHKKILISSGLNPVLFETFVIGILNSIEFISLDSCKINKYEIKSLKGPFFRDHYIFIDGKKYSLNVSKPTPIILFNGNVYHLIQFHYPKERIDSLEVCEIQLNLDPCDL